MDEKDQVSADPTSLTSFGEPKEKSSSATGFLKFILDLFSSKKSQESLPDTSDSQNEHAARRPNVLDLNQSGKSKRKVHDRKLFANPPGSEVHLRIRSFSTLFKDLPKMVRGQQSPDSDDGRPAPTSPASNAEELRQYWMPDDQCHECYECGEKFTTFRRRHHCRICGQIFCSRCCNQVISGKIMGLQGKLRSCMYCCQLVLRFAESNKPDVAKVVSQSLSANTIDSAQDEHNDGNSTESLGIVQGGVYDQLFNSHNIRQRREAGTLQRTDSSYSDDQLFDAGPTSALSILSPVTENLGGMQSPSFLFDAKEEQASQSILGDNVSNMLVKDSVQLHMIWKKVCDEKEGIEFRDHRFRLRKYSSCITGQELVDWLIKNDVAYDRTQGCAIGQALCEGLWMKSVLDMGGLFQDGYVLYQNYKKSINVRTPKIEIYPDHFSAIDNQDDPGFIEREPVWVQEIKCSGDNEDETDGYFAANLTYSPSDGQSTAPTDTLIFSDEEQSLSEQSVMSLSSYVEIDQGEEVIKYTRSSSMDIPDASKHSKNSTPFNPSFDDSSLTSINADYLRNFITWNGTYLNHPWHQPLSGWRDVDFQSKSFESCDKRACQWLREMYTRHGLAFLRQLLFEKGLDLAWAEVLVPLAKHASFYINPNPTVNMDVVHYVQIKKIPDGVRRESQVINGVAFTNNVVNKHMRTDILNPAILLLAIPLEYERVQLRLSALDPVLRQEREFYKHLVTRITSKRPDVVLVQCTVSRIAQELLLEAGITVVVNVKQSVMERVARSTEGDIVQSIDQLLQAHLGRCSRFYLKIHDLPCFGMEQTPKALLYFEGCNPMHGCTVILRSKSSDESDVWKELLKVKDVFRFLVRAMFHVRLEMSYLIDQHNLGKLLKKNLSAKSTRSDSDVTSKSLDDTQSLSVPLNDTVMSQKGASFSGYATVRESRMLTTQLSGTDSVFGPLQENDTCAISEMQKNKDLFENRLNSLLLSTSPLIMPAKPYLYTVEGQKSSNWKYLPHKILDFPSRKSDKTDSSQHVGHNPKSVVTVSSSSLLDKPWLSHSRHTESTNEYNHSQTHDDNNKKQHSSSDLAGDGTTEIHVSKNVTPQPVSCYTQPYKRNGTDDCPAINKMLSPTKRNDIYHGVSTWEQTMVDMIFGPPVKEKKPSQSQIRSVGNISQFSASTKHGSDKFGSVNESNIFLNMNDDSLHEFITCSFTQSASSEEVRDLLSSFRAHAGTLFHRVKDDEIKPSEVEDKIIDDDDTTSVSDSANECHVDSLDPYNHQHISLLFSSYSVQSPNAPYYCVLPWVVDIDFYRGNDITLGGFLERYCFRPNYHCPNPTCRRPMVEHVRSFVHGNMCMSVLLKELSKPFQQSSILTWTWDHDTKKSSAIKTMSRDAWYMSFAKYLEINFGQLTIPQMGSLPYQQRGITKQEIFDEHWEMKPFTGFQYFLFHDLIAAFKCFPVKLNEIVFPSAFLSIPTHCDPAEAHRSGGYDDDIITASDAYYVIRLLVDKIESSSEDIRDCVNSSRERRGTVDSNTDEIPLSREKYFLELVSVLNDEKSVLFEQIEKMEVLLKSNGYTNFDNIDSFEDAWDTSSGKMSDEPVLDDNLRRQLNFSVLQLKCDVSKMVETWNQKLLDAYDKDRNSFWNPPKSKHSTSPRVQRKRLHPTVQEECETPEGGSDVESEFLGASSCPPTSSQWSSDVEYQEDASNGKSARQLKRGISADAKGHDKQPRRMTRTGSSMKSLVIRLLPGNLLQAPPTPFPADEHYLLPECLITEIVVRDAEPTSIIAYTLCSSAYKKSLKHSDASIKLHSTPNSTELPQNQSVFDNLSDDIPIADEIDQEIKIPNSVSTDHVEVQFSDKTTKFYCKVYFADLFQKFRAGILEGGENQYLESLSRSAKWLAVGGKSGSTFHKTKDDQFILKQMSNLEMQSFLEFAPKYVEYLTDCIDNSKATALSKILGVYRISFRNSQTGRSLKQDVLVIENLFYRKQIDNIYDLKGSVRNRRAKNVPKDTNGEESTSKNDDVVLLDENLLRVMCENPIYVHEHAKFLFKNAMQRDTDFLSQNLIMDYSLLIGIDRNKQIFIGIIDFIRTFTWDKKLEMVVKWSSSRSMPTVVSPELYKNRFCEAMDRYFQVVPDRWYGMHLFESSNSEDS